MSAMIKKGFVLCCLAFVFGLGAEEAQKTAEAKTPEMKIAVLDFTCIDLVGQKLRLMKDKPLDTAYKGILSNADRQSIDDRMQGLVRMIDARIAGSAAMTAIGQDFQENARDRAAREALAEKILNSKQRPIIIGAEYMTGYLGEYPETFTLVNREGIESALKSLDFGRAPTAEDADQRIREFSEKSGATHVLIGTVADLYT